MNTRRRAFTLIELLAAMTVFAAIFSTVLLTLYAMQKTSRGLNEGIVASVQQQRFATQLRSDAHQSRHAELKPATPQETAQTVLELTQADNQVVMYQLHEKRIDRQVRSGDAIVHQDSFSVSPVLAQGWSLDQTRPSPLLTIHLNQESGNGSKTDPTLIPLRVDAALRIATAPATTASSKTP